MQFTHIKPRTQAKACKRYRPKALNDRFLAVKVLDSIFNYRKDGKIDASLQIFRGIKQLSSSTVSICHPLSGVQHPLVLCLNMGPPDLPPAPWWCYRALRLPGNQLCHQSHRGAASSPRPSSPADAPELRRAGTHASEVTSGERDGARGRPGQPEEPGRPVLAQREAWPRPQPGMARVPAQARAGPGASHGP